jgi:hypothetical protein
MDGGQWLAHAHEAGTWGLNVLVFQSFLCVTASLRDTAFLFFSRAETRSKAFWGTLCVLRSMGMGQGLAHAHEAGTQGLEVLVFQSFLSVPAPLRDTPFFGGESGEFLIEGEDFYVSIVRFNFICCVVGYHSAFIQAEPGAGFVQAFEFSLFGLRITQVITDLYGLDDFSTVCDQEVAFAGIITIIKNVMASFFQL